MNYMADSKEMTDSQLIAELERRKVLKPTLNVRVGFGSSLKFWLAYLIVSLISFVIAVVIVLLILHFLFPSLGVILSRYGLSFWSLLI